MVVREGSGGSEAARLASYLLPGEGTQLTDGALRTYLRGRLPEYMIPSSFHLLKRFPYSPNGKVDRLALQRAPEPVAPRPDRITSSPANDLEQEIQKIWM